MDGLEEKIQKILSDPEALGSVMEMAKAFTGGDSGSSALSEGGLPAAGLLSGGGGGLTDLISGMDPKMLNTVMSLFSEYNRKDDKRTQLLTALKPYVRGERQAKMERAAQIVRLAKTAKIALGSFGGGQNV